MSSGIGRSSKRGRLRCGASGAALVVGRLGHSVHRPSVRGRRGEQPPQQVRGVPDGARRGHDQQRGEEPLHGRQRSPVDERAPRACVRETGPCEVARVGASADRHHRVVQARAVRGDLRLAVAACGAGRAASRCRARRRSGTSPLADDTTSAVNSPVPSSSRTNAPPTGSPPATTRPVSTVSLERSVPGGSVDGLVRCAAHQALHPRAQLDRHADERAVLGPAAVVVLDVAVAEQLVQHDPGVRLTARRCGSRRWSPASRRSPRRRRACASSSSDLNVPSSLAALLHGMLIAPGMWPGRCDCSCGRCAGARILPENSSGERTSTRFFCADRGDDLVAERADRRVGRLRGVRGGGPVGGLGGRACGRRAPTSCGRRRAA